MTPDLRAARSGAARRAWRWRASALAAAGLMTFAGASHATASVSSPTASSATAQLEEEVLFKASEEEGYACFRIPAVVETTAGTLLAFAEGRVDNCGDAADIDLVVKRSTDGGRTWGPLQVVADGGGDTRGNPAPVVDAETGRILLASTYNEGRDDAGNCEVPCDRVPYLQYSDDDGATWSEPTSLDDELRPDDWNAWYATGPVHGIQLTRGSNAGRLVFSINAQSYASGRLTENHAALAYSDDGGDTWQLGAVDTWPVAADDTFRQKPQESALLERADGSIYVNGREEGGTDLGHRTEAVSSDGGESFDEPFSALPDLYSPTVQGSMLALRTAAEDGYDRWLFAAPADPDRRRTMMLRSSWDEGESWEGVDRGLVVTTDWSGYSDMVELPDRSVGLLYEGGAVDARDEIRFARVTEDDLGPRRAADPTTPDGAPAAEDAAVLGGATTTAGQFGEAIAFDGVDDAVRLPYREQLALDDRDFTVSLWFRYTPTATSANQPFLSMGGVGGGTPQVWLRGEPEDGRISALMTARDGTAPAANAWVGTSDAYDDGAWHHLSLVRSGGTFTLTVDGQESVTTADAAGSVSVSSAFGVHLGQGVDSRSQLAGALDEVRVYDRALTAAELTALRETGAAPQDHQVLALSLDEVVDDDQGISPR